MEIDFRGTCLVALSLRSLQMPSIGEDKIVWFIKISSSTRGGGRGRIRRNQIKQYSSYDLLSFALYPMIDIEMRFPKTQSSCPERWFIGQCWQPNQRRNSVDDWGSNKLYSGNYLIMNRYRLWRIFIAKSKEAEDRRNNRNVIKALSGQFKFNLGGTCSPVQRIYRNLSESWSSSMNIHRSPSSSTNRPFIFENKIPSKSSQNGRFEDNKHALVKIYIWRRLRTDINKYKGQWPSFLSHPATK